MLGIVSVSIWKGPFKRKLPINFVSFNLKLYKKEFVFSEEEDIEKIFEKFEFWKKLLGSLKDPIFTKDLHLLVNFRI